MLLSNVVMVEYIEDARITAAKRTVAPQNRSRTGYGAKIPTSYMVQLDGKALWHRVYCIQYSNAGSIYIFLGGKRLFFHGDGRIVELLEKAKTA